MDIRTTSACDLLPAQAANQGVTTQRPLVDWVAMAGMQVSRCSWQPGGTGSRASITLAAGVAVAEVVDGETVTGNVSLEGFAATLFSETHDGAPACTVAIDIAAGDVIVVTVDDAGPPTAASNSGSGIDPQVLRCDRATETAAHVVGYLVDR